MHSTGFISSILAVAALAAAVPAPNGHNNYTPDAPYKPSTTLATSYKATASSSVNYAAYTPDAPYKPESSKSAPPAGSPTPAKPGYEPPKDGGSGSYNLDLPPVVPVNTRSGNEDLIAKLMTAPTQQSRVRLLNQPGDFVFDFNDSGAPEGSESVGKGGHTVSANARTFPALIGNGAAMTLGFLG